MRTIADKNPGQDERMKIEIGPAFAKCMHEFGNFTEWSKATGIANSSLSHAVMGRPIERRSTAQKYEQLCQRYLQGKQDRHAFESDMLPFSSDAVEPVEENGLLFVSVPRDKVAKFRAICAMFGCDIVDLDD